MPSVVTVWRWEKADAEFAKRIAHARDAGHDVIAADALRIADELPEMAVTEGGARRDAAYVSWQKNRIWARLELLKKWDPKRYGERLEQTGSVEVLHRIHIGPRPE